MLELMPASRLEPQLDELFDVPSACMAAVIADIARGQPVEDAR